MNDILSIIGTIASVGSVPLSIYLYIKSKENNIDKTKREIVRILSHQIGEKRELTSFEIQTVINSNSRSNKIDIEKISVDEIVEDLVSDTISNPLLSLEVKETILRELKNVYTKSELLTSIDKLEKETRKSELNKISSEIIEDKIKSILLKRNVQQKSEKNEKSISESFRFLAAIVATITITLSFIGKQKYDSFLSQPLYNFLQQNDFYIAIAFGALISLITGIILIIKIKLKK
ncbi:hypothetical protein [Chryseobacterium sp.]|uniref:hypothetical protein n=1 Tax=Chryseobacterium sp. TaxID=1871047 RepID=UPI00289CB706|nr:hypothetical protein [Chryseobacterium sp.]